jgi:hypothetical protein
LICKIINEGKEIYNTKSIKTSERFCSREFGLSILVRYPKDKNRIIGNSFSKIDKFSP